MSSKLQQNVKEILEKIKAHYGFKKDIQLARFLGISPNRLAMWKTRNTIDYYIIISKCTDMDLNFLFYNTPCNVLNSNYVTKIKEPTNRYINENEKIRSLELENAELKGQIKILKELLLNQRK